MITETDKQLIFFVYQAGLMAKIPEEARKDVEAWIINDKNVKTYLMNLPVIRTMFYEHITYEEKIFTCHKDIEMLH